MMRTARLVGSAFGLLAFFALIAVLALPALGQEDDGTTTTTAPAEQIVPAVPIEPAAAAPSTTDWTYRYLIPTGLVLAAVVILITSVRYFTNVVRKRYRIVEE
jgi:hypothetical protein